MKLPRLAPTELATVGASLGIYLYIILRAGLEEGDLAITGALFLGGIVGLFTGIWILLWRRFKTIYHKRTGKRWPGDRSRQ